MKKQKKRILKNFLNLNNEVRTLDFVFQVKPKAFPKALKMQEFLERQGLKSVIIVSNQGASKPKLTLIVNGRKRTFTNPKELANIKRDPKDYTDLHVPNFVSLK